MGTAAQVDTAAPSEGCLYVVGTPIGNLGDISQRACAALSSCSLILCEDTRVTRRLCAHLGISVPLLRCDENTIAQRIDTVIEKIRANETLCLVSDAGMPAISDPGQRLVDALRDAKLRVEVIPGPSAALCALVASGLTSEHFFFEGFLPRKAGKLNARLALLAGIPASIIIYESPHRLLTTLRALAEHMPQRRCAVARELTKLHEEVLRGTCSSLAEQLSERERIKGECVIVIEAPCGKELTTPEPQTSCSSASARLSPSAASAQTLPFVASEAQDLAASTAQVSPSAAISEQSLDAAIQEGRAQGMPTSALAKALAKRFGLPRDHVYQRLVELSHREDD